MAEAVRITAGRATLEASGGLTLDRAREVAETGVDFISVGALTHSVDVFDLGLDLGRSRMTLLAADIGNSHTVLGLVDGRRGRRALAGRHRGAAHRRRVGGAAARAARAGDRRTWTGSRSRATVPSVLHEWREMLVRHFADVHVRGGRARHPHRDPGADGQPARGRRRPDPQRARRRHRLRRARRSSSTSAAPRRRSTWSTAQGQYVGGAIAPGIEVSLAALGRGGAQLRKVELVRPRSVIAKNTVEALQAGMIFGVAAQVEGIVARMIAELGARVRPTSRVIATGYLADLVLDECRCFTDHSPVADPARTGTGLSSAIPEFAISLAIVVPFGCASIAAEQRDSGTADAFV